MNPYFIFDTSVLCNDPHAPKNFAGAICVIPIKVLEELDKVKKTPGEAGRNARLCIRWLDELSGTGNLHEGVLITPEIYLVVNTSRYDASSYGDVDYGDNHILACLYSYYSAYGKDNVYLLSNDIHLRVRAKSYGINAIPYEAVGGGTGELYSGHRFEKNTEAGAQLHQCNGIDENECGLKLSRNEYVTFLDDNHHEVATGKKVHGNLIKNIMKKYPWGISPRNVEQACAIDAIMDPSISLVTLAGKAGCGKTLVALASALDLVVEKKMYNKLVVYRPIQPMGNDIGFTPGSILEKLEPWFQGVMDNFETLFSGKDGKENGKWKAAFEYIHKKGQIELGALTYIRGRSIPNALILIDEVQNISTNEIKTILTRAGDGSKIILTGDVEQIDSPKLDAMNNGLSYVIDKFQGYDLFSHVTFTKGERSRLATLSSEIL